MNIQRIVTGAYRANAYLVETGGGEAVLIDPGDEAGRLIAAVKAARCRLAAVFLTHGHLDHLAALPELLAAEPETPRGASRSETTCRPTGRSPNRPPR